MSKTSIEWAAHRRPDGSFEPGHTWNPVTGCTRASAGCDNCYAVRMTRRLEAMGQDKYAGLVNPGKSHFNGVVKCHEAELVRPLRKTKATTYFVNSMSDLFHDGVPFDFIDQVFAVMAMCPEHTFIILTKRAERLAEYFAAGEEQLMDRWADAAGNSSCAAGLVGEAAWPLANVWLGVSIENQEQADKRIPPLLAVPAAVLVLSIEPTLGPIDLYNVRAREYFLDVLNKQYGSKEQKTPWCFGLSTYQSIGWVIVGGESGPEARPMHPSWARNLRDQCQAAGVAFFFKQWGQTAPCPANEWHGLGRHPDLPRQFQFCLSPAGEQAESFLGEEYAAKKAAEGWVGMTHYTDKKIAGRLLDGREHNDRPC